VVAARERGHQLASSEDGAHSSSISISSQELKYGSDEKLLKELVVK
jgi:hypothetical protein